MYQLLQECSLCVSYIAAQRGASRCVRCHTRIRGDLEADGGERGGLLGEQDAVTQQSHTAADGLFGGEQGQFGGVVLLGEVAEDDPGGAAVVVAGEEFGGGVVGEVADAGEDALLDRPGVGAVAEHLEVVVGFEQQDVDALEGGLDVGGHVAEVGGDGHADGFGVGLEDEAAGVGGVVGDGEGRDGDVADGEVGAGVEVLDGGEEGGVGFGWRGSCFVFVGVDGRLRRRQWRQRFRELS